MHHYEVLLASDGDIGVKTFIENQNKISLAVIDLTMPSKRGDIALQEMRQLRPDLPAIIFSGDSQGEAREFADSMAHTEFLAKPFVSNSKLGIHPCRYFSLLSPKCFRYKSYNV